MGIVVQGVNIKPTVYIGGLHIPKELLYKAIGIGAVPLVISGVLSLSAFPILSGVTSFIFFILCLYLHPHLMRFLTIIVFFLSLTLLFVGLAQFASIPLALYLCSGILIYIRDMARTGINHAIRYQFEENFVPDSFTPYGELPSGEDPLYDLLCELDFSALNFSDEEFELEESDK